ncbi:hypothetical protein BC940DRAFT_304453 [Gongronella butleri]|nr:hypothetical protein BC940DRAFT_304453 [Gongronella butleri]
MKSTVLALAAVVSMANAIITFKEPWTQSPAWKAGDKAMISWISDAQDVDKPCFIEMLTGDATNAKVVAAATDPKNPIKCGKQQLEVNHLNDFASGTYWLRIGQKDQNVWYYSGVFKFDGKGSFDTKPIRMQGEETKRKAKKEATEGVCWMTDALFYFILFDKMAR